MPAACTGLRATERQEKIVILQKPIMPDAAAASKVWYKETFSGTRRAQLKLVLTFYWKTRAKDTFAV
jgi:hypothetical protein